MQYFTVEAVTPREALEKMRRQYGEEARILTHKNVHRGGLLGFFAKDRVEITGYVPNRAYAADSSRTQGMKTSAFSKPSLTQSQAVEEAKKKILAEARREQTFQQILKEIKGLRENLDITSVEEKMSPGIAKIEEIMRQNDFSKEFYDEIIKRIRHEFSLEDLENYPKVQNSVVEWIGEKINIYPPLQPSDKETKVFIIVGPTGVGKTTTIAKLAAINRIGNNHLHFHRVKIVTIDNYRIAARQQIETYAEIMKIPISFVESRDDFKKVLALSEDKDLILVDTIGKSPRDLSKLAEMKEILDTAGSMSEIHLAISATTKSSDVDDILKNFEPFRYRAIILTKLDETLRIGNVVSVLAKSGKPISYIADGQGVPQDIEEASVVRLLMNLDGFRIDRERIEKIFGKKEKVSKKYWS